MGAARKSGPAALHMFDTATVLIIHLAHLDAVAPPRMQVLLTLLTKLVQRFLPDITAHDMTSHYNTLT